MPTNRACTLGLVPGPSALCCACYSWAMPDVQASPAGSHGRCPSPQQPCEVGHVSGTAQQRMAQTSCYTLLHAAGCPSLGCQLRQQHLAWARVSLVAVSVLWVVLGSAACSYFPVWMHRHRQITPAGAAACTTFKPVAAGRGGGGVQRGGVVDQLARRQGVLLAGGHGAPALALSCTAMGSYGGRMQQQTCVCRMVDPGRAIGMWLQALSRG